MKNFFFCSWDACLSKDMTKGYCFAVLLMSFVHLLQADDPCNSPKTGKLSREKYRGSSCKYETTHASIISDRYIDKDWYKITGANGQALAMPTSAPAVTYCSTIYPIWMNGTHPSAADGIVNRTTCAIGNVDTCATEYRIQVKNCGTYYVYNLDNTGSEYQAYCFGDGEPCPPLDPCVDLDREEDLKDDGHRSAVCTPDGLCDSNLNLKSGWRLVTDSAGSSSLSMTNTCPSLNQCGATYPMWMNDSAPSVSDGIANRTVCVRNETSCCSEQFDIEVKNCGNFMVYNLQNINTCPRRYCFGTITSECELTTTAPSDHPTTSGPLKKKKFNSLIVVIVVVILVGGVGFFSVMFMWFKVSKNIGQVGSPKNIAPNHESKQCWEKGENEKFTQDSVIKEKF